MVSMMILNSFEMADSLYLDHLATAEFVMVKLPKNSPMTQPIMNEIGARLTTYLHQNGEIGSGCLSKMFEELKETNPLYTQLSKFGIDARKEITSFMDTDMLKLFNFNPLNRMVTYRVVKPIASPAYFYNSEDRKAAYDKAVFINAWCETHSDVMEENLVMMKEFIHKVFDQHHTCSWAFCCPELIDGKPTSEATPNDFVHVRLHMYNLDKEVLSIRSMGTMDNLRLNSVTHVAEGFEKMRIEFFDSENNLKVRFSPYKSLEEASAKKVSYNLQREAINPYCNRFIVCMNSDFTSGSRMVLSDPRTEAITLTLSIEDHLLVVGIDWFTKEKIKFALATDMDVLTGSCLGSKFELVE